MVDEVREAAKKELRRRAWASKRGRNTRLYLSQHPELISQFESTGTIRVNELPAYVTKASLLIELGRRARDKEVRRAVREWRKANPEEAERLRRKVVQEDLNRRARDRRARRAVRE